MFSATTALCSSKITVLMFKGAVTALCSIFKDYSPNVSVFSYNLNFFEGGTPVPTLVHSPQCLHLQTTADPCAGAFSV